MRTERLGPGQERGGKVLDGLGVQLRDRADLEELAAGIFILDGLQKAFRMKYMSGPPAFLLSAVHAQESRGQSSPCCPLPRC